MSKRIEKKKKVKNLDFSVRGMRYYVTPSTLENIAAQCPLPVRLEREPKNQVDPNAIRVILDTVPWENFHIGHVAALTAKVLAPKMDADNFHPKHVWLMSANMRGEGEALAEDLQRLK